MSISDVPSSVELDSPNAARIYDYALGGNHNFAVDREFADRMWADTGCSPRPYRMNRSFLRRALRFMLDRGIDQFLDLGSGIPTVGNVHEIVHAAAPGARVVYVDNEPIAVAHARQLLANARDTAVVEADLRDVKGVLDDTETLRLLDPTRPLGLLMVASLHFVPEEDDPAVILARYRRTLTAGGYLALSHFTADGRSGGTGGSTRGCRRAGTAVVPRGIGEIRTLLAGFDLVKPGVVWTPCWRPDVGEKIFGEIEDSAMYAAVGAFGRHAAPVP